MGTSPIGKPTMAKDLEAQQHCSSWISKVEKVLLRNEEHPRRDDIFYISKVPEYYRQPSADFTPKEWIFGLHNREKLNISSASEALKLSVASALGLVGQKWRDFCEKVVSDQCLLDMKQCYGLGEEVTILTDEVIRYILALDALFLVVHQEMRFPPDERFVCTPTIMKGNAPILEREFRIRCILNLDLCLIENQVPFSVIINIVLWVTKGRVSTLGSYEGYTKKLIQSGANDGVLQFMDISRDSFKTPESLNSPPSTWKTHFLAIAYELICGHEGLKRRSDHKIRGRYLNIPSASKLRSSGVTIKGEAGPLELLSYKDGCLCLPQMRMFTDTLGIVQNIALYEYTQVGYCMFHDYTFLMEDLIKTPRDVEILVECGVFSECGLPHATILTLWTEFGQRLMQPPSSKEHNELKEAIIRRCKLRRYTWWDEFRSQFCSRPWFVISVLTVTLVPVATLIQTYVAVIGSNGMKPHFP